MDGVILGLIFGAIFLILYGVDRYKKEDISLKFVNEKCTNKNSIYVYWSRNNPAGRRPVPIFIDGEYVGNCKKNEISKFNRPSTKFQLTCLVPHNQNIVEVDEKGPIYVLVNHLGKCERYYLEEEDNG
ncbi:MAG: hypothetical protein ACK5K7_03610 [Bacilli bacterium]